MKIPEHRLDDTQALAVERAAFAGVDPRFHGLGVRMRFPDLAAEEGDLAVGTDVWLAQALRSERAVAADLPGTLEADTFVPLDDGVGRAALEHLSVGTAAGLLGSVVVKVFGLKPVRAALAGQALLVFWFVPIGFGKTRIA